MPETAGEPSPSAFRVYVNHASTMTTRHPHEKEGTVVRHPEFQY